MASEIENFRDFTTPSGEFGNYWRIDEDRLTVSLRIKAVSGYVHLWKSKESFLNGDRSIHKEFFRVNLQSWSGASEQLCFSFWKAIINLELADEINEQTSEVISYKKSIFFEEGV